jgi:hypothetical protein
MEDLVLCYDNTSADATSFAKRIHESLLGILEAPRASIFLHSQIES